MGYRLPVNSRGLLVAIDNDAVRIGNEYGGTHSFWPPAARLSYGVAC
jgi:hypothetical protein